MNIELVLKINKILLCVKESHERQFAIDEIADLLHLYALVSEDTLALEDLILSYRLGLTTLDFCFLAILKAMNKITNEAAL